MTEQNQFPAVFHGEIANQTQLLCNARELHEFLQVGRDFSNWIKNRINKYKFVENQDFILLANFGEQTRGGHNRTDYHITLDMAKELAMVENNATGRQIRRYFIECEKELRQQQNLAVQALPPNYIQLLQTQIKLAQRQTGLRFWEIYQALNTFCGVSHYAQISLNKFHQALDFLLQLGEQNTAIPALAFDNGDILARKQVQYALKAFSERYGVPLGVIKQDMYAWFDLPNWQAINQNNAQDIINWLNNA